MTKKEMSEEQVIEALKGTKFQDKKIYKFEVSEIRPSIYIVLFMDGTQTNVKDIYYKEEIN